MSKRRKIWLKIRPKKHLGTSASRPKEKSSDLPQSLKLKRFSTDFDGVVTYLSPVLFSSTGHYIVVKKAQGKGRIYVQLPFPKIISHYGLTHEQIKIWVKEVKDSRESLMSIANRYDSTGLLDAEFVDDEWERPTENNHSWLQTFCGIRMDKISL